MASPAALETSDWVADADEWIEWRATQPGDFTADDLRRAVPDAPSPYLPGLAFRKASTRGLIVSDAAQRSTVRSRKGSLLCTWRGVETCRLCEDPGPHQVDPNDDIALCPAHWGAFLDQHAYPEAPKPPCNAHLILQGVTK